MLRALPVEGRRLFNSPSFIQILANDIHIVILMHI